jgi:class 3 adenylate cyclase
VDDGDDGFQVVATLSALRVDAAHDAQRRALHGALPQAVAISHGRASVSLDELRPPRWHDDLHDGADASDADDDEPSPPPGAGTSVHHVCSQVASRGCVVTDSADWPLGVAAFADWAAAAAAPECAPMGQCVTAPLVCGTGNRPMGFVVLCFPRRDGFATSASVADGGLTAHDALRQFCDAVGAAVQMRRAKDAAEATARALAAATTLTRDICPPHMMSALEARIARRGLLGGSGSGSGGGSSSLARRRTSDNNSSASAAATPPEQSTLIESHPAVTVLLVSVADIADITTRRSAEQALALLDALWTRCDTVVAAHGVFKVDAPDERYLAVAGMFPARADHARAALRLALELHAAAARVVDTDDETGAERALRLCVSLHSGDVASGVVGHVRARLCVFGNAVRAVHEVRARAPRKFSQSLARV